MRSECLSPNGSVSRFDTWFKNAQKILETISLLTKEIVSFFLSQLLKAKVKELQAFGVADFKVGLEKAFQAFQNVSGIIGQVTYL